MRITDGVSDRIDELRRERSNFSWHRRFSYFPLFHDDLYATVHSRFSGKSSIKSMDYPNLLERYSLLTIKRLINQIRRRTLPKPVSRKYNQGFLNIDRYLFEGMTAVSEMIFSVKPQFSFENTNEWNDIQSVHSIPLFMEHKFFHLNHTLDLRVPYPLHPEILIRLPRQRIRDVTFLHSLRLILHNHSNTIVPNTSLNAPFREDKRLFIILWNHYLYEFEDQLVSIGKRFSQLRPIPYIPLVDRSHFFHKIKYGIRFSWVLPLRISLIKNPCVHYVRYGNHCVLALEGSKSFARKWMHYLIRLWQYNYHSWFQPQRISFGKSSKCCSYFLGYIPGFRSKAIQVKVRMMDSLLIARLIFEEFCPNIPISFLTRCLAREGFCDSSGYPISRSAWTTSTDDDITNRFNRVWKSFSLYYSGPFNTDGLYRVKYILQFSCAKTLACKHKSTIRTIWKKFGSKLVMRFFLIRKPGLTCSKRHFNKERFWCLDVIQTNPLIDSAQEL
uniref:Maturase K n=1 Tax=Mankyua chejuensis TaxID=996148 RepID=H8Y5Z0_9MONI|nr:maturase K [Mankyua chejuensis]ADZ47958.1 maturase K [Mankyua chejuensis]AJJ48588.1 maturase K [Mankyua chejuensis]